MHHKDTQFDATESAGTRTCSETRLLDGLLQVQSIAQRIHRRLPLHVPIEDLIQAGTLGLLDAISKFNPTKRVQLETYAKFRIHGAIIDSLRAMDWGPRHLRGHGRSVEAARQELLVRFGREPNEEELAREMHMSVEKFQHLESALYRLKVSSLDSEPLETQSGQLTYLNVLATAAKDPFSLCFRSELRTHIERAMDALNQNERRVLTLYYLEELTMKAVGKTIGLGESRVSQIHTRAVFRLREQLGKILQSPKGNINEMDGIHSDFQTARIEHSDPNRPRPTLTLNAKRENGRRQSTG